MKAMRFMEGLVLFVFFWIPFGLFSLFRHPALTLRKLTRGIERRETWAFAIYYTALVLILLLWASIIALAFVGPMS